MKDGATHGSGGGGSARYDPAAYGDRLAAEYDVLYPPGRLDTDATVEFLAQLAESRPSRSLLEFGIGTGRLAIKLHSRGIQVAGIDASERMIEVLRTKAPSADIDVVIGDYASTCLSRTFSVVALVFNNVFDPRGVSTQLQLFANAARHLEPGGCFVVEAFVLDDEARNGGWTVSPRYVGADHVELQMSRFDIETNIVARTLVYLRPEGSSFVSVKDAYAGPAELDLMAHVNGMRRIARYADWSSKPFTARSRRHVTVYERV